MKSHDIFLKDAITPTTRNHLLGNCLTFFPHSINLQSCTVTLGTESNGEFERCMMFSVSSFMFCFFLFHLFLQFSSVQFSHSVMSDSLQPPESQHARPPCPSPSPGVHSHSCPRVCDAIQPSHPLSSLLPLPPLPPSIRAFSNEPTLRMRWPKYWSFSFSISPSNEHPGLISFRID